MMHLVYDETVDAASVEVDGPTPPGRVDGTERLDRDRFIKFDADDRILVYEFHLVRRHGVRLDDLEHRDELRALFREAGFSERDWSTPLGAGRRIGGETVERNGMQAAPAHATPGEAE